jgi:hypothetical protein
MLVALRRLFSFSDWNQHHPKEQPPGDMLDASFDALINRISELEGRISTFEGGFQAFSAPVVSEDDDWAGTSQAWAESSRLWAEHMPDTLPDDALKITDITGDHWSARWWAHKALETVNSATDINLQTGLLSTLWYKATEGQIVFPMTVVDLHGRTFTMSPSPPEQIAVSVNGIRLLPKPDALPDGDWTLDVPTSSITLLRPLRAGDIVAIDVIEPVAAAASGSVWGLVPLTGMNGVLTTFPLVAKAGGVVVAVAKAEQLVVSVDGVVQEPITSYNATGATITFVSPPTADSRVFLTWFAFGS